ncbi:putative transcription factor C2H2 family [Helianthus debilis subsp. tardiflorus]
MQTPRGGYYYHLFGSFDFKDSACMLLRRYNWNVINVHEAWFANEDKVRQAVGLLDKTKVKLPKAGELLCGICFESFSLDKISSTACGHPFCNSCWTGLPQVIVEGEPMV